MYQYIINMQKKLTIIQLVDCVLKLSNNNSNNNNNFQIKPIYSAIDDMTFYKLKYGATKNI